MNTGDPKLISFGKWLQNDLDGFVAFIEEGSVVAGDAYQPSFSDHDLSVVVGTDTDEAIKAMDEYLSEHPLGNEYLVSPRSLRAFLSGDTLNDLSLKFRSTVIAGEDVIQQKSEPSQAKALKAGIDGLEDLMPRFERRWLNLAHWDLDYAQHKNYEFFKGFFVFTAAVHYGRTGYYPKTRSEMADLLPDQKCAQAMYKVVNDMGNASKEDQRAAFTLVRKFIPDWVNES